MKLLTIIPARSGSKGIKNKNLTNFLGKPLINYSINFAKKGRQVKKKILLKISDIKNHFKNAHIVTLLHCWCCWLQLPDYIKVLFHASKYTTRLVQGQVLLLNRYN